MSKTNVISPYMPYINPEEFGKPDLSRLLIFDTTLRDGEQTPGAAQGPDEKEHLARFIYELGVDAMEVSFATSGKKEIKATHKVIKSLKQDDDTPSTEKDVLIYSLSRAIPADIDVAWKAVNCSRLPGIHTFVSTSDEHREAKFPGKSKGDIKEMLAYSAGYAAEKFIKSKKRGMVEVSAEDALRTPIDFLVELNANVMKVIKPYFGKVGFTFNIPDTVGVVVNKKQYLRYIRELRNNVPDIEKVILSAHIHNDHGLAVGLSMDSIEEGVRQIECTVNGIGERAGNASLEQIMMILEHDIEGTYGVWVDTNPRKIYAASVEIAAFTGYHPSRNQPVVGSNTRSHEAGIHQHGQLQGIKLGNLNTYEGIAGQEIGAESSKFPLGRRSGVHALEYHLLLLGYNLERTPEGKWNPAEKTKVHESFLEFAEDQRTVTHRELRDLMLVRGFTTSIKLPLEYIGHTRFTTQDRNYPEGAVVRLRINEGNETEYVGHGQGQVEAVVNAMRQAVGNNIKLKTYFQNNRNTIGVQGEKSYARTEMRLQDTTGRFISGEGYDLDIGKSAAKAFANALNLDLLVRNYEKNNNS